MKLIPYSLSRGFGRTVLQAKKNSPHIFFVGGLAGSVGSTFLACKATLQLEAKLDEIKEDLEKTRRLAEAAEANGIPYSDQEHYRQMAQSYVRCMSKIAKLYGPSMAVGAVSIAALTGSHIQLTRRNTALTAAFAAVSRAYEEYRARVREELGEERELELYRCMEDVEYVDEKGKKKTGKAYGEHGPYSVYAVLFDEGNPNWRKEPEYNRIFIQAQQNYANDLLRTRGHVFLNEVYDVLGFEHTQPGCVVGWVMNGDGDNYIDFGMLRDENENFLIGRERNIWLDFNVDGVVYDKI